MSKVYSIKDITNYENHIGYDLRTPDGKDIRFSDNIEHIPFMYNEIKVRTKEQQAIDNLKAIINSKDEIIEIEPPVEDTAQILLDYITNLQRQIEIMERYLELICDLGYDYDGYNKSEDLKGLINELVHYASLGRACNDKEAIFEDGEGMKVNILDEIILKKVENE